MLEYTKKELEMKKVKSFSKVLIALLCTVFLIIGLLLTSLPSISSKATSDLSIENTIKVEAIARENENLSQDHDGNTAIYLWRQLQGFRISFDETALAEGQTPPLAADGKYTMTLHVGYYAGLSSSIPEDESDLNDDFILYENVASVSADNYTNLPSITFNVDNFLTDTFELLSEGQVEISTQGWGIYRFTIDINGAQSTSNYFAVDPDHLTNDVSFDIAYEDAYTTSGHNAFNFYVIGADTDFKYVNKDCFVWYVYGQDFADNNYVLTENDATGEFAGYQGLFQDNAIDRRGETFYFDDNGHAGNWNVYCVYQDDYNGVNITSTQEQSVMTGDVIKPSTIVWVVVGVSIAVLAIVIVVIVISVRKEKVW